MEQNEDRTSGTRGRSSPMTGIKFIVVGLVLGVSLVTFLPIVQTILAWGLILGACLGLAIWGLRSFEDADQDVQNLKDAVRDATWNVGEVVTPWIERVFLWAVGIVVWVLDRVNPDPDEDKRDPWLD